MGAERTIVRNALIQNDGLSKKGEVQEALPPAGVIGAESLTLVPQHFPRKPA